METWTLPVLINVGSFCTPRELMHGLGLTNKHFQGEIRCLLAALLREYIVNGWDLQGFSGEQLVSILSPAPHLLEFLPLYYNGGLSNREIYTSFESLWEFSGTVYSTFYSDTGEGLIGNRLAVGYFSGRPGQNLMSERFHFDVQVVTKMPWQMDAELRAVWKTHRQTMITLDFLTPSYTSSPQMLIDEDTWNQRLDEIFNLNRTAPVLEKTYPYAPLASGLAIVREVCVARPFNYTGPVKTMLIVVGKLDGSELSTDVYKQWEEVDSYEKAVQVGSGTMRLIEGVETYEYAAQLGDYWPLLWVNFLDIGHNHVRVPLLRPQCFRTAALLLSSIDDRRTNYSVTHLQPNFDIMFTVFLGNIAAI